MGDAFEVLRGLQAAYKAQGKYLFINLSGTLLAFTNYLKVLKPRDAQSRLYFLSSVLTECF